MCLIKLIFLGMVLVKMLGFLEMNDSEMLRIGDKIRKNFKREIESFLKQVLSLSVVES